MNRFMQWYYIFLHGTLLSFLYTKPIVPAKTRFHFVRQRYKKFGSGYIKCNGSVPASFACQILSDILPDAALALVTLRVETDGEKRNSSKNVSFLINSDLNIVQDVLLDILLI